MNVMAGLEFKLAYYDVTVQYVIYNARWSYKKKKKKKKKEKKKEEKKKLYRGKLYWSIVSNLSKMIHTHILNEKPSLAITACNWLSYFITKVLFHYSFATFLWSQSVESFLVFLTLSINSRWV